MFYEANLHIGNCVHVACYRNSSVFYSFLFKESCMLHKDFNECLEIARYIVYRLFSEVVHSIIAPAISHNNIILCLEIVILSLHCY